jgi:hypothetical protein
MRIIRKAEIKKEIANNLANPEWFFFLDFEIIFKTQGF